MSLNILIFIFTINLQFDLIYGFNYQLRSYRCIHNIIQCRMSSNIDEPIMFTRSNLFPAFIRDDSEFYPSYFSQESNGTYTEPFVTPSEPSQLKLMENGTYEQINKFRFKMNENILYQNNNNEPINTTQTFSYESYEKELQFQPEILKLIQNSNEIIETNESTIVRIYMESDELDRLIVSQNNNRKLSETTEMDFNDILIDNSLLKSTKILKNNIFNKSKLSNKIKQKYYKLLNNNSNKKLFNNNNNNNNNKFDIFRHLYFSKTELLDEMIGATFVTLFMFSFLLIYKYTIELFMKYFNRWLIKIITIKYNKNITKKRIIFPIIICCVIIIKLIEFLQNIINENNNKRMIS